MSGCATQLGMLAQEVLREISLAVTLRFADV
jgi:hypothetical protein